MGGLAHSSEDIVDCHLREIHVSCEGLPFYDEWEGERYCVLHFPAETKSADMQFQKAVERKCKAKNFVFGGVYFPSCFEGFAGFNFKGDADFNSATFEGEANFAGATFEG